VGRPYYERKGELTHSLRRLAPRFAFAYGFWQLQGQAVVWAKCGNRLAAGKKEWVRHSDSRLVPLRYSGRVNRSERHTGICLVHTASKIQETVERRRRIWGEHIVLVGLVTCA
jgi:hypothetical protein